MQRIYSLVLIAFVVIANKNLVDSKCTTENQMQTDHMLTVPNVDISTVNTEWLRNYIGSEVPPGCAFECTQHNRTFVCKCAPPPESCATCEVIVLAWKISI